MAKEALQGQEKGDIIEKQVQAGLLSLEAFEQRRKEIDEATERATRVREEMLRMHQRIARAAFKELDRHIDIFSESGP